MPFYVYLGGNIRNLTYQSALGWREEVTRALAPEIVCLSPMRAKTFLKGEERLGIYDYNPLTTSQGVKTRDKFDIRRSDLILFNFLGSTEISMGSVWESGFAEAINKPIVIVMENDNVHQHVFLNEGNYVVDSLDQGLWLVKAILIP